MYICICLIYFCLLSNGVDILLILWFVRSYLHTVHESKYIYIYILWLLVLPTYMLSKNISCDFLSDLIYWKRCTKIKYRFYWNFMYSHEKLLSASVICGEWLCPYPGYGVYRHFQNFYGDMVAFCFIIAIYFKFGFILINNNIWSAHTVHTYYLITRTNIKNFESGDKHHNLGMDKVTHYAYCDFPGYSKCGKNILWLFLLLVLWLFILFW
jgi:hypothetical protein